MGKLKLEGVRIVEFCRYWAGTTASRLLVPMGAEVIKIESSRNLDGCRLAPPQAERKPGVNRGGQFHEVNFGKLGVTLNLRKPEAIDLVKELVKVSDVVTENFVPGVMARLGIQ